MKETWRQTSIPMMGMERQNLYQPKDTGFEREISKRLDYWAKLRTKRSR